MNKPALLIITGAPGTGKTTLGKRLSEQFSLPFINKDGIKESLFDTLGIGDREWSRKLGYACSILILYFISELLDAGVSLIIESNFRPENDDDRFKGVQKKYDFRVLQIFCHSDNDVILQRYEARSHSAERHPGHLDHEMIPKLSSDLNNNGYKPLNIGGDVIDFDTTDFSRVDYDHVFSKINSVLNNDLEE